MNGTTMWSCDTELCTNGVEASKCWVFIVHFFNLLDFTVSLSCRDCHSETPWSHSSNQQGGTYCQARDFLLRTKGWGWVGGGGGGWMGGGVGVGGGVGGWGVGVGVGGWGWGWGWGGGLGVGWYQSTKYDTKSPKVTFSPINWCIVLPI